MRALLSGATMLLTGAVGPAWAASPRAAFDVPAQAAVTAIPEFARQAGLQIIAPADNLGRVRTPAVRGVQDVGAALARLIGGTGLEVAAQNGRTVTLRMAVLTVAPPLAREADPLPPSVPIDLEPLVVFGGGQARQVQLATAADIAKMAPGTSALRLVSHLPSVNLASSDAFGANEWSTRISVRNFVQGRLGFTLDEVPLGDMTYGNHNGLHVSRAVISENVESVELAQGAGSVEVASSSNLGGTLRYRSREPDLEPGGYASIAGGSDQTFRATLRLESGARDSGLRAAASYAYNTTRRWQGAGQQYAEQVNLKAVQPIGDVTLSGFVNLSRRRESDPQDLTLDMVRRLGGDWDNIPGNWALAVRLAEIGANRGETAVKPHNPEAGTVYPTPFASVDDVYFDSSTARDDALAGLTLRAPLDAVTDLKVTAYAHWNRGQGLWWTPFVASPNYGVAGATEDNAPIAVRSTEYDIRRKGVIAAVTREMGDHTLSLGGWLEENDFVQARRFYGLDLAAPQRDYRRFQSGPFLKEWAYHFSTRTRQAYIQDVWRLDEDLTLTAGFKALSVTNRALTREGPNKDGVIVAESPFLPRLSLAYRPSDVDEVFAHYGRGMRAFSSSNTSGPFAGAPAAFAAIATTLKPEISDSYELGWRRHSRNFTLLTAVYGVQFRNRLFSTPVGRGIEGNPSALANVGRVTAYGVESALSWRFDDAWTAYASYAFNHASYDDDVFDGDGVRIANTKGKLAVDAPEHLVKAKLEYDRGGAFVNLTGSYLSRRYLTFENDQSVPAQFIADLSAGYRFSGSPWRDGLTAQLNITNLFDARYISTIGSNDFAIRGDRLQTVLIGAPRQVFISLRKTF